MRAGRGPTISMPSEGIRIPGAVRDLQSFRRWARSGSFPERGRIDWIAGEMEIEMTPEDLNTHGATKSGIAREIGNIVEPSEMGMVYTDRCRLSTPSAELSVEPDVVVLLFETVESGRVKLIPKASREAGRYVEIEGAPDLVVECVSDSSEGKDTVRLKDRYFRAGIREYWIVDARSAPPSLMVLTRGRRAYRETPSRADGFIPSAVLGLAVRLVRIPTRAGLVRYRLETRPL